MKFRPVHKVWGAMAGIYTPKNRKQADDLMRLHTNMGDDIEILEDWPNDAEEDE